MRNRFALLPLVLLLSSCSASEQAAPELAAEPEATAGEPSAPATEHLGGCIMTSPIGAVPEDLYAVSEVTATDEFPPFTKKLTALGLTLVARDDASDDFMRRVAKAIEESFPRGEGVDRAMQEEVLRNHYRYRAVIPVPVGEDMSFVEEHEQAFEALAANNSVCDIIMEGVPGQVMEVVEHILHYVSDLGLHYAFPEEWGISETSVLRRAMNEVIEKGYYKIESYDDIDDLAVRDRVVMQEFAYWVISTAWNLQVPYGPAEEEWTIRTREELEGKLPELYAALERTVDRVMVSPSLATLREFGPTRSEERAGPKEAG